MLSNIFWQCSGGSEAGREVSVIVSPDAVCMVDDFTQSETGRCLLSEVNAVVCELLCIHMLYGIGVACADDGNSSEAF